MTVSLKGEIVSIISNMENYNFLLVRSNIKRRIDSPIENIFEFIKTLEPLNEKENILKLAIKFYFTASQYLLPKINLIKLIIFLILV